MYFCRNYANTVAAQARVRSVDQRRNVTYWDMLPGLRTRCLPAFLAKYNDGMYRRAMRRGWIRRPWWQRLMEWARSKVRRPGHVQGSQPCF